MARTTILEAIEQNKVLVSDGGWGTMMQTKGLKSGDCPELWCFEEAELVRSIARAYIDAGAELIETNSFGGTRYKLGYYQLDDKVREINMKAAQLSREAAGEERWVMGSMGPTGKMTVMGDVTEQDFFDAFKEQAAGLAAGGADALMIETMSALDEAAVAVRAGREVTGCEIIGSFTFERTAQGTFRTMMGVSPAQAAKAAVSAGADIIGANCGKGYDGMEQVIKEFRDTCPDVPVLIQTNAGIPKNVNGMNVFPATPEEMADQVSLWIETGANIIGGCCGTTPEHIRAIREAVEQFRKGRRK